MSHRFLRNFAQLPHVYVSKFGGSPAKKIQHVPTKYGSWIFFCWDMPFSPFRTSCHNVAYLWSCFLFFQDSNILLGEIGASLTSLISQKLSTCDVFWCVLVATFESLNLTFGRSLQWIFTTYLHNCTVWWCPWKLIIDICLSGFCIHHISLLVYTCVRLLYHVVPHYIQRYKRIELLVSIQISSLLPLFSRMTSWTINMEP